MPISRKTQRFSSLTDFFDTSGTAYAVGRAGGRHRQGHQGGRQVLRFELDEGFLPGEQPASDLPAGYIGDGVTPHTVKGADRNHVRIEALDLISDTPVNFAVDANGLPTNQIINPFFVVQGLKWDGDTQAILASDRVSYRRSAGTNATRVDAFAVSGADSTVTIQDLTTTAPQGSALPSAVTLDKASGVFSTAQNIGAKAPGTLAGRLPLGVELVANGVNPEGTAGQTTRLVRGLKDSVVISQADYDPVSGTLTVRATSSDAAVAPTALIIDETANIEEAALNTRLSKTSDFGLQLRAKQKLKGYYANITEKQFRRYYAEAIRLRGDSGDLPPAVIGAAVVQVTVCPDATVPAALQLSAADLSALGLVGGSPTVARAMSDALDRQSFDQVDNPQALQRLLDAWRRVLDEANEPSTTVGGPTNVDKTPDADAATQPGAAICNRQNLG